MLKFIQCIVANVNADADKDLGTRFGVEGFPTIKFFPAGSLEAEDYKLGRTEADFVNFLNEKCGTKRTVGGGLTPEAGRISSLDAIASKFISAPKGDKARKAALKEAKEVSEKDGSKYAQYYAKVMAKIDKDGDDYVSKETARLERISESGTTTREKRDDFIIRKNILGSFVKVQKSLDDDDEEHSEL